MHNTINNNDDYSIIDADFFEVVVSFLSSSFLVFSSSLLFASKHTPSAPPQDLQLQAS